MDMNSQNDEMTRMLFDCNIDAMLILSQSNTEYLSGYESSNCQIIITKDHNYFVTDLRYASEAKKKLEGRFEVVNGDIFTIRRLLIENNCKSVGFDGNIGYFEYKKLIETFGNQFKLEEISQRISKKRSVKSLSEINKIRKAQEITDNAFDHILTRVRCGVSEIELAAELEYFILKNGGKIAFDTICAFGENGANPHAHRSDRKLKQGDFITLDFGAKVDGYCSDMTRTIAYGEISTKQAQAYNAVLEAHMAVLNSIKANMRCCDCDKIARDVLTNAGYGEYFSHSLGHGVGIDIHETPFLNMRNNDLLEVGNVVTDEPGVYIDNQFGIRIEDTLLIESDKAISFARSDKKLIILN